MCLDVQRKWVWEPGLEIPAGGVLLHFYLGALFLAPGHQIAVVIAMVIMSIKMLIMVLVIAMVIDKDKILPQ